MIVTSKIRLDMAKPGNTNTVYVVQGDGNTRAVEAELLANGSSWTPDGGWEAAITYRKPDGTKGLYNLLDDGSSAITISGSTATVILAQQMMTVPGTVRAAIVFNNQRLDQLTSFPFLVSVARNQFAGAQQSEDYIRLQWLEDKLEEYLRKAADSGAFDGAPWPRGEPGPQGPQGPQGEPGVSTKVNGIAPDETGNVTLTAADVGALPSDGGDMTGAINMNGQSVSGLNQPTEDTQAANKGYVDAAKAEAISHANAAARAAAPRNLLDNSDFRNPVNQRGKTTDNATDLAYAIDRWVFGDVTYKLTTNGITLTPYGSGKEHLMAEYLEKQDFLIGKRLTFAVGLSNGNVCIATGTVPQKSDWAQIAQAELNGVMLSVMWSGGTNYLMPRILVGKEATVAWAALYEGEYTAETLPEYQPKGYGAELAECQRYYMQFVAGSQYLGYTSSETSGIVDLYIPNTFRATPSISITDINWLRVDGTHYSKPTATINVSFMRTGLVGLSVAGLSITVPQHVAFLIALGEFSLSADL